MAIWGKDNIIELVRMQKAPYWKIFETELKATNGTPIVSADYANDNLGLENSLNELRKALGQLTPGTYIFRAYTKAANNRGVVDSRIEIEPGSNGAHAISGIPASEFYLEGIGKVTPENFESAIEAKFKKMKEAEAEKERIKKLEQENAKLKKEITEYDSGINEGLFSIGSVVWSMMRNTDMGKEFMGIVKDMNKTRGNGTASTANEKKSTDGIEEAEVVDSSVGSTEDAEKRMETALEKLAKDNPELIEQLELLAKTKERDPETFNQGLEFLKSM